MSPELAQILGAAGTYWGGIFGGGPAVAGGLIGVGYYDLNEYVYDYYTYNDMNPGGYGGYDDWGYNSVGW